MSAIGAVAFLLSTQAHFFLDPSTQPLDVSKTRPTAKTSMFAISRGTKDPVGQPLLADRLYFMHALPHFTRATFSQ
jgi:hypothetical protein